jgi:hypothetical protein
MNSIFYEISYLKAILLQKKLSHSNSSILPLIANIASMS